MAIDSGNAIVLSNGMVAIVDAADHDMLRRYKWTATPSNRYKSEGASTKWYAARWEIVGYKRAAKRGGKPRKRQRKIYMHRFLMNAPAGKVVDHINGDGLDNRRANLRVVSQRENCQNVRG